MHTYLACRFCKSELPPRTSRTAFCNNECKRLYAVHGNVENWKGGIQLPKPSVGRKTSRRQGNTPGTPKKRSVEAYTVSQGYQSEFHMIPVRAGNGNEYQQFVMVLDYPEDAPPSLTGGANLIKTGGKNGEASQYKKSPRGKS